MGFQSRGLCKHKRTNRILAEMSDFPSKMSILISSKDCIKIALTDVADIKHYLWILNDKIDSLYPSITLSESRIIVLKTKVSDWNLKLWLV